jgi:hypothetical protein
MCWQVLVMYLGARRQCKPATPTVLKFAGGCQGQAMARMWHRQQHEGP